ncbi:hypothetical protein C3L33_20250, partial [Rhododendron williamsianum]
MSSSHIQKMDWNSMELRINNWLSGVKIAVKTLFNGERILCDHVFASSDSIRESCFAEITREGAQILFGFPEHVAKIGKKKASPEKVFRLLDMYTAIPASGPKSSRSSRSSPRRPSCRRPSLPHQTQRVSTSHAHRVRSNNPQGLVEISRTRRRRTPADHARHGLRHAPGDYSNVLADILAGQPPPSKSSLPESYFDTSDTDDFPEPAISLRFAWLILVLLCKLDGKAKQHKEVSLSYLFLANNLQHIVNKVRTSNVKYLLGDEWVASHEAKVKQFAANYERLGWGGVIGSLPEDPTAAMPVEEAKERFRRFNASFEQAHRKQSVCIVQDSKLRDEIKVSIARKVVGAYTEFYDANRAAWRGERNLVRYAPEDVGNYLSDLFFGSVGSGSSSSLSSTSSTRIRGLYALLITMDLQATGNRVTDIVQRGTPWQHLKHKTVAIQLNSEEA